MEGVSGVARKKRAARGGRWVACSVMGLAGVGLVAAVMLGAPLVSILLVGILLLCPLLLWVPFRFQRRSLSGSIPGRRTHA